MRTRRAGRRVRFLSGGERVKLARELDKKGGIHAPDGPTTGLHASDERVMELPDGPVDCGNAVLVIEHNPDVMKRADSPRKSLQ